MNPLVPENFGSHAVGMLTSAWPEEWCRDWFVCDPTGVITGPLDAAEVFDQKVPGSRAVARRGFAQWYDERDFAGLWHASRLIAPPPKSQESGAFGQPGKVDQSSVAMAVSSSVTDTTHVAGVDEEIMNAFAATGVSLSALAAPVAEIIQLDPKKSGSPEITSVDPKLAQLCLSIPSAESNKAPVEPRLLWLSRRAGARLGNLRNPVVSAAMVILSCGFYYTAWILTALREVVWHLDHDTLIHRHVERPWLAWIPGGHMIVTWDVARLIRAMEEEDGYTSTSPKLAVFLALMPPLAVVYLQHAMNDHWLIHCIGAEASCSKTTGPVHLPIQNELNTTSKTSSA